MATIIDFATLTEISNTSNIINFADYVALQNGASELGYAVGQTGQLVAPTSFSVIEGGATASTVEATAIYGTEATASGLSSVFAGISSTLTPIAVGSAIVTALGIGATGLWLKNDENFYNHMVSIYDQLSPVEKALVTIVKNGKVYVNPKVVQSVQNWLVDNNFYSGGKFSSLTPKESIPLSNVLLGNSIGYQIPNQYGVALDSMISQLLTAKGITWYDNDLVMISTIIYSSNGNHYQLQIQYHTASDVANSGINITGTDLQTDPSALIKLRQGYSLSSKTLAGKRLTGYFDADTYQLKSSPISSITDIKTISQSFSAMQTSVDFTLKDWSALLTSNGRIINIKQSQNDYDLTVDPNANPDIITTPLEIPQRYPRWQPLNVPNVNPDGSPATATPYMPISIPVADPTTITDPLSMNEAQQGTVSDTGEDAVTDGANESAQDNPNTNPNPPSNPPTVTPIIPTNLDGLNTGFTDLYIPTRNQLHNFSTWLWGGFLENGIDELKKIFTNPMEAIIGLQVNYAPISSGGTKEIQVGKFSSGVTSNVASNQYVNINCGNIKINEFYGNYFDYNPYTRIQIYLPFIGFRELDADLCVGSTMSVTYRCDLLSGACVAHIRLKKDNGSDIMAYAFNGSCSVQLPITAGNLDSITRSVIGLVATTGLAIATDGASLAVAGAVGAGINTAVNAKQQIQQSGGITGNAGALSVRKPYLIITRDTELFPRNYQEFYGKPILETKKLSQCSGYTKVRDVHVHVTATESERTEIEALLKNGVIL